MGEEGFGGGLGVEDVCFGEPGAAELGDAVAHLVEFFGGHTWTDPAEDEERMASARAFGAAVEPFASGVYVNVLSETGEAGVRRAYGDAKLARLAALKHRYDPDNIFHLNQNIAPAR